MKNTTGLYKHQRDNQGARRKLPTAEPRWPRVVPCTPDPECGECGFGLTTNAHRQFCGSNSPYDAGADMNGVRGAVRKGSPLLHGLRLAGGPGVPTLNGDHPPGTVDKNGCIALPQDHPEEGRCWWCPLWGGGGNGPCSECNCDEGAAYKERNR